MSLQNIATTPDSGICSKAELAENLISITKFITEPCWIEEVSVICRHSFFLDLFRMIESREPWRSYMAKWRRVSAPKAEQGIKPFHRRVASGAKSPRAKEERYLSSKHQAVRLALLPDESGTSSQAKSTPRHHITNMNFDGIQFCNQP